MLDRLATLRAQIVTTQAAASDASEKASAVSDRFIKIEIKQVVDVAASDKFQIATLTRLDRVQDSLVALSNAVSDRDHTGDRARQP